MGGLESAIIMMLSHVNSQSKTYITIYCNVKLEDIVLEYVNRHRKYKSVSQYRDL